MSNDNQVFTILLCGVGGQGTITAADLLARVATAAGKDCKVSEIHGMAQRGGAVTTVVRFGDVVSTIVSFEVTEALRNIDFLKTDGVLVVNDESIKPLPVLTGKDTMPSRARERLLEEGATLIPASDIAREAGTAKCANVVLLGALAPTLPFDLQLWEDVIKDNVPPKTVDINIDAFRKGAAYTKGEQ